jgi:phosphoribosylglycinamide formyltransferase-1
MRARVGILLSGRGSNFRALHAAMVTGQVPAEIALVVSNRAEAPGLAAARELGLETAFIPYRGEPSREAHDAKIVAALRARSVEWVCLAGYMRLLSKELIRAFPQRILNIHPSLLPAFPGLEAQRQALEYGVAISGCTVHLVDEELDHGPVVVQRVVAVEDTDTVDTLSARILEQEHRAYPDALRRLLTLPWRLEGRRLLFS